MHDYKMHLALFSFFLLLSFLLPIRTDQQLLKLGVITDLCNRTLALPKVHTSTWLLQMLSPIMHCEKALISTSHCNSSSHHPEIKVKLFFLLNQDYNQLEAKAEDAMGEISGEWLLEKQN